ncbi:hypothetical protein WG66_013784, partial [Moniliophthora roreri]
RRSRFSTHQPRSRHAPCAIVPDFCHLRPFRKEEAVWFRAGSGTVSDIKS